MVLLDICFLTMIVLELFVLFPCFLCGKAIESPKYGSCPSNQNVRRFIKVSRSASNRGGSDNYPLLSLFDLRQLLYRLTISSSSPFYHAFNLSLPAMSSLASFTRKLSHCISKSTTSILKREQLTCTTKWSAQSSSDATGCEHQCSPATAESQTAPCS